MNKSTLKPFVLASVIWLLLIFVQGAGIFEQHRLIESNSKVVNSFKKKYADAVGRHDEDRKDQLVEILIQHQSDWDQLNFWFTKFASLMSSVFSAGLVGVFILERRGLMK